MKKCKFCMEEIDERATICPHCRKKQKASSSVAAIIIIVVILIAGVSIAASYLNMGLEITNGKGTVSALGQLVWEGDITNKGFVKKSDVKIEVTCYTETREVAGKATTTIKYIEPGETLHFTATGLGQYAENLTCEHEIK